MKIGIGASLLGFADLGGLQSGLGFGPRGVGYTSGAHDRGGGCGGSLTNDGAFLRRGILHDVEAALSMRRDGERRVERRGNNELVHGWGSSQVVWAGNAVGLCDVPVACANPL